jgi:hypothetical protein
MKTPACFPFRGALPEMSLRGSWIMRKTAVGWLLLLVALFALEPVFMRASSVVYPVGTTIYKPDKCWNGFTILSGQDGRLIDMNGNLVHLWKGPFGFPNKALPGGHLLVSRGVWKNGLEEAAEVQVRDFNDRVIWKFNQWQEAGPGEAEGTTWVARQHHDIQIKGYRIPDYGVQDFTRGTLLVLGHYNVKNDRINRNMELLDDVVYEVDMATGEVTWSWKAAEHVDEMGFDKAAFKAMQNYSREYNGSDHGFDWFHQNCASYLGPNKWFDQGDRRFHPDNIILSSRHAGILAIVDHATGKIVWKTGPYYREGDDKKLGWIIGPHHTHIIPKGLPGEGNIMVYDNGGYSGYGPPNDMAPDGFMNMRRYHSRVIEFDPITKDIVWEYSPASLKISEQQYGYKEFSPFVSSAQRLQNGNTLITEGSNGRAFEVTRDLEVVWEYISPYSAYWDAPKAGNMLYRAYRVPYEWVPQLPKPAEVAVDPGPNHIFMIPAVDGSKPDFGIDKTPVWNPQDGW